MLGQAKRIIELNDLIHLNDFEENNSKFISITSGKGGTGKSFVASNLAFNLSQNNLKVLLIDMDINLSNIGALLNISSKKNLYHYLNYQSSLEEIIYRYSENFDLIFGESGKIDHPKLTDEKINLLFSDIKHISDNYDVIIFDTASGAENSTLNIISKSDEVILVTTPEPTSIMDAYVILKMLNLAKFKGLKKIIINKCFEENEGEKAFNNLEMAVKHFLKIDINYLGSIQFSTDVIKSIKDQSLLMKYNESSIINNQIKEISSKFLIHAIG